MKILLSLTSVLLFLNIGYGQVDTVKVKSGDVLYGKVKKINSGVLVLKTSYSDSDFRIDFEDVTKIHIQKTCFVMLSHGRRRTGKVNSEAVNQVSVTSETHQKESFQLSELIQLEILEDVLWKRFSGNFDVGYNLTRANNAAQLTFSGGLYYKGPKWYMNTDFNSLRSRQDNIDKIERTNAQVEVKRILLKKWYLLSSFGYLSNTQQALNSRYLYRLGAGRYLVTNNKLLLGLSMGVNYNMEDFVEESKASTETFISANLNLFNFKDVELVSRIDFFPSLSESGRRRLDYMIDAKYKLPMDFYIKAGLQFNYDNQSKVSGSNLDYIFTTGFGWEFN